MKRMYGYIAAASVGIVIGLSLLVLQQRTYGGDAVGVVDEHSLRVHELILVDFKGNKKAAMSIDKRSNSPYFQVFDDNGDALMHLSGGDDTVSLLVGSDAFESRLALNLNSDGAVRGSVMRLSPVQGGGGMNYVPVATLTLDNQDAIQIRVTSLSQEFAGQMSVDGNGVGVSYGDHANLGPMVFTKVDRQSATVDTIAPNGQVTARMP